MTTPAIKDVTEQTRTIVCNQRAYEVPLDVANSFVAMREALRAAVSDIFAVREAMETPDAWDRCEMLLGTTQAVLNKALAMSDGKAVAS